MIRIKTVPIILVDNRENLDYKFIDYHIILLPATLNTGDYSVAVQLISKDKQSIIDYILKYYGNAYTKDLKFDTIENNFSTLIKFDKEISIERKTLDNFTGDLTESRERFEDSVKRGSSLKYYAIFIEGSEMEVLAHKYTSKILPQSVLNTAIRWSVKYHVPILFVDNRLNAEYHTYEALIGFLDYKKRGIL